jgi:hypothetical protein
MSNPRFPIMGTEIPLILGRTKIMQQLWNNLTKPTPSNLSLVGPRFIGKTVIMNALAKRIADEESPYKFVLYWHIGHVAPASDEDFITQLCEKLRDLLSQSKEDTSVYCEYLKDHCFSNLAEVVDSLNEEDMPIIMLWDGFDKPLGQGNLTVHLWDQMRTIFYGKKHKIVTATRRPLSESIRSQDAITSPFWNIFDMTPMRVGIFDDQDCDAIIGKLSQHTFQSGAKTELIKWSAGFPPFFLEILNQINANIPSGQVDNDAVSQAARKATEKLYEIISATWNDCSAEAKDLYIQLVDHGEMLFADAGKSERNCLIEKGFAHQSSNKLAASCRILQEYIKGTERDTGSMARLFGTWDDYETNIRDLLERRLGHISHFDDRLQRLIARAIEDIPEYPNDCLNNLTSIEEQSLDLIWQREFGQTRVIPQEIIDYWEHVNLDEKIVQRIKEQPGNVIPGDRGLQCGILQLLTGSRGGFETRAKYATKDTYVLINALHSFRNRSQHADGQSMHVGVAVAAIMICLELLSCLDRELAS